VPAVKTRLCKISILVVLILAATLTNAHPADAGRAEKIKAAAAAVDKLFREHAASRQVPGLAYGVVYDGQLVLSGGCGYANIEQKLPADAKSLFRIASMSKSFTALAILQLRDAGKLSLDDPASKYLPEMKNLHYPTTDAPEITIRHLLTHGAGLPEDNPWGDRQLARTDAELQRLIPDISFANAPGIAFEYSNLGFALLGQIVQRVSGMEFQEYTTEKIFKPLGMNATVWEYEKAPQEKLARGYDRSGGSFVNIPLEHHGAYGAMGGLITSIEDFARYAALHLSAWPPRDGEDDGPLKRSSLREMHHPWRFYALAADARRSDGSACAASQAYAYGLRWASDCDGIVSVGHAGGLPGFGSNWMMLPEYGIAVVSFTNLTYSTTTTINRAVLDTLITLAELRPHAPPVSEILEQRKNELVRILPDWQGAVSANIFAENFFPDNPLPGLVRRSKRLYEEAGEITRIGPMVPQNHLRGTFILEGTKKKIAVFFTLSPEKEPLIQELRMSVVETAQRL
jgi:CubicO group peptidase (beta-lactamase class C family)